MLILYNETRKIFIIQEREKGIIVVNIVPKRTHPKNTGPKNTMRRPTELANAASLLHLVHMTVIFDLFLQSSAFGNFLLLALALNFLCDKVLIRFQTALDVDLELDDVVKHTLELCVELFAHGGGAQSQLFVPGAVVSKLLIRNSDSGVLTQDWYSSLSAPSAGRSR